MSRLLWFVLGGLTVIGTSIVAVALEDMSLAGNSDIYDDDDMDDDDDEQINEVAPAADGNNQDTGDADEREDE